MLSGSCACGRVRYEIRGDLVGPITFCHCWRCRKHSGSSFGTLDADPGRKADLHFMVGSKVPWLEIHDPLPQEPGGLRFGERDRGPA